MARPGRLPGQGLGLARGPSERPRPARAAHATERTVAIHSRNRQPSAALSALSLVPPDVAYQSSQIDALIANQHGIFGMFEFREVHEFEKFWAIGSGKAYALGAMYEAYERVEDPTEIAKIGVRASCEFDNACELPLSVYVLDLKKEELA